MQILPSRAPLFVRVLAVIQVAILTKPGVVVLWSCLVAVFQVITRQTTAGAMSLSIGKGCSVPTYIVLTSAVVMTIHTTA